MSDKMLVESMQKCKRNNFLYCDWNDINSGLECNAFDTNKGRMINHNLKDSEVGIILEVPTRASTHVKFEKVMPLLEKIASERLPIINPAESFLNFSDKSYMFKFPELPFPKTEYLDQNSNLSRILSNFDKEIILKPLDGDGGYKVEKVQNNVELVRNYLNSNASDGPFLVQEFLKDINLGEKSLFFFNKEFKYGILKRPKEEKEFHCNEGYCFPLEEYFPSNEELKIAKNALFTMKSHSMFERVDMTHSNKIIEMTLDCPGLYIIATDNNNRDYYRPGFEDKIGKWFYELVDATLLNQKK
ncbi:MAG: hypothetical protein Q7S33_02565 [Nanoarchaeota archaeon]|nr:hypothetical protein [Nanoarchaeota archaeon]